MKTKTKLAAILLILITAVNTPAKLGDTIPCRYEVARSDPPGGTMILIEWGHLEQARTYMIQTSCGSPTNWRDCLPIIHPEATAYQLGTESHTIEPRCAAFFWRMIDTTPIYIEPGPLPAWLHWLQD